MDMFSSRLRLSKRSATVAGFSALLLIVGLVGFNALFGAIGDSRKSATAALEQAAADTSSEKTLERKANLANTTQEDRATLAQTVVAPGGSANFISQVEAAGSTAGVSLELSGITQTPPKKTLAGALSLTATFSGSYAADIRFVSLVETLPVVAVVDPLSLSYDQAKKVWIGDLTLSALSYDAP